jgi:hypothetical protein
MFSYIWNESFVNLMTPCKQVEINGKSCIVGIESDKEA